MFFGIHFSFFCIFLLKHMMLLKSLKAKDRFKTVGDMFNGNFAVIRKQYGNNIKTG